MIMKIIRCDSAEKKHIVLWSLIDRDSVSKINEIKWIIDTSSRIRTCTFYVPLWLMNAKKCGKAICMFVIAAGVAAWLVSFRFLSDIRFRFRRRRDVYFADCTRCVTTPGNNWSMVWSITVHAVTVFRPYQQQW